MTLRDSDVGKRMNVLWGLLSLGVFILKKYEVLYSSL